MLINYVQDNIYNKLEQKKTLLISQGAMIKKIET